VEEALVPDGTLGFRMTDPVSDAPAGDSPRESASTDAAAPAGLPREAARKLAHDLRTPLSAMSGWIHLLETGALDAAGQKRALAKLRGNIEDQVKTIERYLGTSQEGQG
jgi:signal transduction histidine kinase